jgi:precorrin-4 methylase
MITADEARKRSFETINTSMLERIESEIVAAAERGLFECRVKSKTVSKYSDVRKECDDLEKQLIILGYSLMLVRDALYH